MTEAHAGPVRPRRLTVVAPAYNEAEGIGHFVESVLSVLDTLPYESTLLVVNDGSSDATRARLDILQAEHPGRLGVVHLARNFGHQAALTAGMDYAEGDAVITMDADMQHPPALLPELLRRFEEGADIVQTIRRSTDSAGWGKRVTSRAFYALVNRFSSVPIEPNASDFRLISRRVADVFKHDLRERDRFLRGLVRWVGYRMVTVGFDAPARYAGRPKYSFWKMVDLARIGLISFSKVPLRIAVLMGLVISGLSLLYGVYAIVVWLFVRKIVVPGWASTILVGTFLGGANLFVLGLVGEYVASIFEEIKGRPIYVVEEARLAR